MNPSSPQYWYHDYLVIIGFNPMLAGSFIIFHPYSSPICSMFALQPVLNNHASWKSPYEISIFFQLVPILNHDFSVGRPHILTSCQTCPSDGIRMRRCSTFWCVWSRGSWWLDYDFPCWEFILSPTDELIFFRGVGIPPTRWWLYNQVCGYLGQPGLFPALSGDIFGTLRQLKITYLYMFFPLKRSSYRRIIYPWNLPISRHIAMEISAHRQGTNIVAHFRMSWSVRCKTFSFFGVKIGVGARSQLPYFIRVCNGSHGPFIDDWCCFLMFFRWCTSFNRWIMFNIEHGPWLP